MRLHGEPPPKLKPCTKRGPIAARSHPRLSSWEESKQILRDSGGVQLPGHLQAVEALHPADGFGQHLSGLHGGHLPAGLRQVTEVTQPRLSKKPNKQKKGDTWDQERRGKTFDTKRSLFWWRESWQPADSGPRNQEGRLVLQRTLKKNSRKTIPPSLPPPSTQKHTRDSYRRVCVCARAKCEPKKRLSSWRKPSDGGRKDPERSAKVCRQTQAPTGMTLVLNPGRGSVSIAPAGTVTPNTADLRYGTLSINDRDVPGSVVVISSWHLYFDLYDRDASIAIYVWKWQWRWLDHKNTYICLFSHKKKKSKSAFIWGTEIRRTSRRKGWP